MGSNSGGRVRWYQAATWLRGSFWPWCAAFCVRMALQAGFVLPYLGAGAYAWYDWARKVGWGIAAPQWNKVVPGDFVVFRIGAGHIAIVEKIVDGAVHSIDGNASNMVKRCIRPLSQVYGFVHLPETPKPLPKPVKPPVFEVVTSENGHKVVYVSGARAVGRKISQILKRHPNGVVIRRKRARKR